MQYCVLNIVTIFGVSPLGREERNERCEGSAPTDPAPKNNGQMVFMQVQVLYQRVTYALLMCKCTMDLRSERSNLVRTHAFVAAATVGVKLRGLCACAAYDRRARCGSGL